MQAAAIYGGRELGANGKKTRRWGQRGLLGGGGGVWVGHDIGDGADKWARRVSRRERGRCRAASLLGGPAHVGARGKGRRDRVTLG